MRADPTARQGVAVVDVAEPLGSFDFSTADAWFVVVLHRGTPIGVVWTPSPGAVDSAALAEALIGPLADRARFREAFVERMRERAGAPPPRPPRRHTVSVIVCTHRRPAAQVERLLASLGEADPPPLEVVLVDNDPVGPGCRAIAARFGCMYVREDRRGLDNARNAGIAAARGEILAFTDDDVVVAPGWLSAVDACFEDPTVAAATGPVFPLVLDTAARVRMETQASLSRGLGRRVVDWTSISPVHAGSIGAGANMVLRRSALGADPAVFPPELDAGTPTGSGGDTYVLARILAAGHRIVYEPRQFLFHEHRPDAPALRAALLGYGRGLTAAYAKLLLEDRELEAPGAWAWVLRQYADAQLGRLLGRGGAAEVRLASLYLAGALQGLSAYARARRTTPERRRGLNLPPPQPQVPAAPAPDARGIRVSVIVPTVGRPQALARCLQALAAQEGADPEVIVVDDGARPTVSAAVRVLHSGGRGAAAARNLGAAAATGDVLLFLDDDLVATPTLVAQHAAAHRDAGPRTILIGRSPPDPDLGRSSFLAASAAALWWHDHFRLLADLPVLTFTQTLSGNMSMRRDAFLGLGGFDERFGTLRREDWEFGLRALRAGCPMRYVPDAVAVHRYALGAAARLRLSRLEARGDVLMLRECAEALPSLRAFGVPVPGLRRRAALAVSGPVLAAHAAALPLLEGLRLRRRWVRVQQRGERLAYAAGLRDEAWPGGTAPTVPVDVDADTRLPDPGAAPPALTLTRHGHGLMTLPAAEPWWHGAPWERIADRLPLDAPPAPPVPTPADVVVARRRGVDIDDRRLAGLLVAFEAPRVQVAIGRVGRSGPLSLSAAGGSPRRADVIAVRRPLLELSGTDGDLARLAPRLAQAAVDAGGLVAWRDLGGDEWTPESHRDRWLRRLVWARFAAARALPSPRRR